MLLLILLLLLPILSNAQQYVDVADLSYSKTGATTYRNTDKNTVISIFDSKILLPIVLNEKTAIVSGFDFNIKNFQLVPDSNFNTLYYTRLKLGFNSKHSDKWSGLYVLLPILSSYYKNLALDDVYIGGIALMTYKKNKNFNYKFGLYAGNEAYGFYITPLVGIYYQNPSASFEISALIPGLFDVNYGLSPSTRIGLDYKGNSETFKIHNENSPLTYIENNTLEFSSYLQNNSWTKNLLLRLKIGIATNTYDQYAVSDKIDLAITPIRIGDNRTKLNTNLNSGAFVRIQAIYRFPISPK